MSKGPDNRFVKQYSDQQNSDSIGSAQAFHLQEIIDPKNAGKKNFSYDSDRAQNFDKTNVKRAREGAKEILAHAITKAKSRATQIREEAKNLGYTEGRKEGFKKGELEAKEEFAPLAQGFEKLTQELSGFRKKMYGKVEREMIELVVSLTQKIIRHELSIREDGIKQMIQLAVESVLDKESMVIKVNPADKEYAEEFRDKLHQLFDEIKNITFEAAPSLERGGCVIETNFGVIDARIHHLEEQIGKILSLTPISFEEGQTKFPTQTEGGKKEDETKPSEAESLEEAKAETSLKGESEDDLDNLNNLESPESGQSDHPLA